ncbi:hypothetical protein [Verrucomicrobium spinosum]|uniref:hypothetical protein n=1 Tax=Verrucomicrobium spinosum TaxID=2736 RepID=UPI000174666E|nr:hypothetical protein [Verrucomicrobium spinosum]
MATTSEVEKGLKVFLDTALAGTMVLEAATVVPVPDTVAWVQVKCARVPRIAGPESTGGLYDAEVEISACTPVVAGVTETNHRELLGAIRGVVVDENVDEISAAMVTAAGANVQGWYFIEPVDAHGSGMFKTTLRYTFALEMA